MKCPICGKEMKNGEVYIGMHPMSWINSEDTYSDDRNIKDDFFSGYFTAYRCYDCKIIIMSTDKK